MLFEAVLLGTVGATIGLALGVVLALGIRALFASFGLDLSGQPLVFAPRTCVASYVVGIGVTTLAAYLPARRASRIAPVAALRDDIAMPESALHRRLVVGVGMLIFGAAAMLAGCSPTCPARLLGRWRDPGRAARRRGQPGDQQGPVPGRDERPLLPEVRPGGPARGENALRNPRRTAATASALMIGLALVTTMAIVGASSKASVDKTIADNFQGDLFVSNVVGAVLTLDRRRHRDRPGVASVTRVRFVTSEDRRQEPGHHRIDPRSAWSAVRVAMVEGEFGDLREGTVRCGRAVAEDKGLEIEDHVTMSFPTDRRSSTWSGSTRTTTRCWATRSPHVATLSTGATRRPTTLLITVDEGTDVATVQDGGGEGPRNLPTVTVKDQAGFAEEQRAQFDQMLLLIYALLGSRW